MPSRFKERKAAYHAKLFPLNEWFTETNKEVPF